MQVSISQVPVLAVYRFDKKSQAEAAISGMNGVVPEGGTEPLVVKVAEEHGKMKAAYYAGYHAGINNLRGGATGESTRNMIFSLSPNEV